ncbi:hypothetical protein L1987_02795 [Smallanthus sonchifolius]|uniref:Uncharacterized protein n=1 Tax=Smallanthus sonchifolius TaxID=185202 RepID=A0ACB9K8V1_9ASTR|nr:hypothetical protein L1987_02795 [Smallanthus sonchifolius]
MLVLVRLNKTGERCNQIVSILSMDGVGGIWKIKKVNKGCFQLMVWVCVDDDLDVYNISKVVCGENQDFANLNLLQVAFKVKEKLLMKRFLLVFDDVWNENLSVSCCWKGTWK